MGASWLPAGWRAPSCWAVRPQCVPSPCAASRLPASVWAWSSPGENIADFNDALNTLRGSLAYLYTNTSGDRYWFDTRPTLRKTAQDRATQVAEADVEEEIETRLKKLRREEPVCGIARLPGFLAGCVGRSGGAAGHSPPG